MTAHEKARQAIFNNHNPYSDFTPTGPVDLQGWNGRHPAMTKAIKEMSPKMALELGSWKGMSSVFIAEEMRRNNDDCCLICVDTFYGSPEHWDYSRADNIAVSLLFKNGRPNMYYTFLSNVVQKGLSDIILPFPQATGAALQILARLGMRFDFIYVDAGHDYTSVYNDLAGCWSLLNPGGVIVGDDFTWDSVELAVNDFCDDLAIEFGIDKPKYIIKKDGE